MTTEQKVIRNKMSLLELAEYLKNGGDTVRNLQLSMNPQAEHILDRFHITMRLTVLGQLAKSVTMQDQQPNLAAEVGRKLKRMGEICGVAMCAKPFGSSMSWKTHCRLMRRIQSCASC